MIERNFLLAVLVAVVIGAPIVYHEMDRPEGSPEENEWGQFYAGAGDDPNFSANLTNPGMRNAGTVTAGAPHFQLPPSRNLSARTHSVAPSQPYQSFQQIGFQSPGNFTTENSPAIPTPAAWESESLTPTRAIEAFQHPGATRFQPTPPSTVISYNNGPIQFGPNPTIGSSTQAFSSPPEPSSTFATTLPTGNVAGNFPGVLAGHSVNVANMTPDYGAVETYIFPGNEFGPDLTAQPLENLPITDFGELFRFDITKEWVLRRWKRVSTNPVDHQSGLSGLRVALVTGGSSWDLHGSLTYYFDEYQKLQRITYVGWTGDPQKLIQLLTNQFQFKSQPTPLAGFYLAKSWRRVTGGMMMKTPEVIDSRNPLQQYGIVLEINQPKGRMELSDDFHALIAGSHPE